jgi:AcrR family transcriptional regulator
MHTVRVKKTRARQLEPRRRRTADEARAAILDAAERRLVTAGPAGIRLQEVAADVGVSHPTVLHHFGSRENLVREVCERRYAVIRADLAEAMARSSGGADEVAQLVEGVSQALRHDGHARVVFWLALEHMLRDEGPRMAALGTAAHALRSRRRKGKPVPLDDTLHVLALSSLALMADAVLGDRIFADLGLGSGPEASRKFRTWLARVLADHLEHGPR